MRSIKIALDYRNQCTALGGLAQGSCASGLGNRKLSSFASNLALMIHDLVLFVTFLALRRLL